MKGASQMPELYADGRFNTTGFEYASLIGARLSRTKKKQTLVAPMTGATRAMCYFSLLTLHRMPSNRRMMISIGQLMSTPMPMHKKMMPIMTDRQLANILSRNLPIASNICYDPFM